jgi:hypothetical protein
MMNGLTDQFGASLAWLLEEDRENPGPRYFALRELLGKAEDDPEVATAQKAVMVSGPVPAILDAQDRAGFWVEPGPGYLPKYRSTIWQIIFLAQLGADVDDPRVRAGCDYVLEHTRSRYGGLSATALPSGLIHCMQGNLEAALIDLGWLGDERLDEALDWLARSITGRDIAPNKDRKADIRYLRSGNSGPGFPCSANGHQPCAWGAVKAMLALSKVPEASRTPSIEEAIEVGVDFLFSRDPAAADYPMGYSDKPNRSWFKFGYPIGYVTDVLQNLEVLTALGYGGDPRLETGVEMLLGKRDARGRWLLEYTYNGKTWVDVEEKGKPSKWVTLRALRVLEDS